MISLSNLFFKVVSQFREERRFRSVISSAKRF